MKIIKPYAKIMDVETRDDGIKLLKKIEWCARVSHRSEEAQGENSWERFIMAVVLQHGDWSVVEHAVVTCDMYVDMGITHEIVRHRLFSYTQESTRFVNYEKKMVPAFVQPAEVDNPVKFTAWKESIDQAERSYQAMITAGCKPQIARSVFPNALASRIIVTGNLRNWRHFLIMRTTLEAHPQMREVTIPLLADFKVRIPILFDDIEPMEKQATGMKRMR